MFRMSDNIFKKRKCLLLRGCYAYIPTSHSVRIDNAGTLKTLSRKVRSPGFVMNIDECQLHLNNEYFNSLDYNFSTNANSLLIQLIFFT